MAAELIEAGVDVADVYRRLYEDMPAGKLALMALALGQLQRFDDGELTLAALSAEDFERAQAEENYSEGIIDQLRAAAGHEGRGARARAAQRRAQGPAQSLAARHRRRRRCLGRSPAHRGEADTAARPASPPRSTLDELIAFLRAAIAAQLHAARRRARAPPHARLSACAPVTEAGRIDGVLLIDKPAGMTSHDVVAAVRRCARRARKTGHAGTLDPFATGLLLVLVGQGHQIPAAADGAGQAL